MYAYTFVAPSVLVNQSTGGNNPIINSRYLRENIDLLKLGKHPNGTFYIEFISNTPYPLMVVMTWGYATEASRDKDYKMLMELRSLV